MNSYAHSLYKALIVFFTALLLLLLTQYSHAAITIGSSSQQQAKTSSISFNHTLASGTSRMVVVGISIEGKGNIGRTTSITYAGVAMHAIPNSFASIKPGSHSISSELFYLTDVELPASGSQTIQVTHDGTNVNAGALQLNGVVQGNPEAVATNAIKSPSSISASINTLTANALILDVAGGGHPDDRAQLAANAAQTSFWGTSASSSQGGGSTRQVGAAGSYTQQWSTNGMNRAALSVVAFAPADGGTPVNQPPVLNTIGNQSVQEGTTRIVAISATDADGDALNITTSALPSFATFADNGDGTATLTLTPQVGDAGSSPITVSVNDGINAAVTEALTVEVTASPNQAPVLNPIGNQTVQEGATQVVAISATDADGDALIITTSALPSFATFADNGDGTATLTLAPQVGDAGTSPITVSVNDGINATVTEALTVDVTASPNQAPVLNPIGNQTVQEGATQVVAISATDADGDTLSITASALPSFATFADNGDGTATLTLTPQVGDAGSSPITVSVNDGINTSVTETITILVTEEAASNATGKLNDTGISTCGDYAFDAAIRIHNQDLDCTLAPGTDADGDPIPDGQDGQTVTPSSFTKISATGATLPESATEWACVKDNTTGFIWEAKTSSGLHSQNDKYMWYDPAAPDVNGFSGKGYQKPSDAYLNPSYNNSTIDGYFDFRGQDDTLCADAKGSAYPVANCNMLEFANKVNEEQLCGLTGWRIPARDEIRTLTTLVDMRIVPERLAGTDNFFFPNTQVSRKIRFSGGPQGRGIGYAVTETAVTQTNKSWIMYFGGREVDHEVVKQELRYVRLVNGTPNNSPFTVSADRLTVIDSKTGLEWKRCVEGFSLTIEDGCATNGTQTLFTWKEALESGGQLYAGKSDWRVPNLNELTSITDISTQSPAIDESAFPNTPKSNPTITWTSSIHISNGARAWAVSFYNGGDRRYDKNNLLRVRLVRDLNPQ